MAMTPAERARKCRAKKREAREKAEALGGGVLGSRRITKMAKRAAADSARADRVQRAVALLDAPIPPRGQLLDEALRILRSVGLDPGAAESSRVSAGRALMDWASGDPGSGVVPAKKDTTDGEASSPETGSDGPPGPPAGRPTLDQRFQ
jgi:hypothetical protein